MNRILFVDDEPKILDGLRRMLRVLRREWQMEFALSGPEALERLAAAPFDVVVTDMRMPGMDGAELLGEVMRRHPAMVRIVLSGQCDHATVLKTVGPAHQFLTKPCDSESLKAAVAQACRLRDQLADDRHKRLVSRIAAVPSLPAHYDALMAELGADPADADRVRRTIAADVGMTAKMMQVVSSGFFGSPQRVADPLRAASLFDLETIKALATTAAVFAPSAGNAEQQRRVARLTEHSLAVARAARGLARAETGDVQLADDAYLAGFLHDVGILVLAEHAPDEYPSILAEARRRRITLWESEEDRLATHHGAVGGYLMALWGLPDPLVQAIAHHHHPGRTGDERFSPLTAVHVASVVIEDVFADLFGASTLLDGAYLERLGLESRFEHWNVICREAAAAGDRPVLVHGVAP